MAVRRFVVQFLGQGRVNALNTLEGNALPIAVIFLGNLKTLADICGAERVFLAIDGDSNGLVCHNGKLTETVGVDEGDGLDDAALGFRLGLIIVDSAVLFDVTDKDLLALGNFQRGNIERDSDGRNLIFGHGLVIFQRNGVGFGHVFDIISDSRLDIIEHLDIKGHADVGIIVGRSLRLNNQLGNSDNGDIFCSCILVKALVFCRLCDSVFSRTNNFIVIQLDFFFANFNGGCILDGIGDVTCGSIFAISNSGAGRCTCDVLFINIFGLDILNVTFNLGFRLCGLGFNGLFANSVSAVSIFFQSKTTCEIRSAELLGERTSSNFKFGTSIGCISCIVNVALFQLAIDFTTVDCDARCNAGFIVVVGSGQITVYYGISTDSHAVCGRILPYPRRNGTIERATSYSCNAVPALKRLLGRIESTSRDVCGTTLGLDDNEIVVEITVIDGHNSRSVVLTTDNQRREFTGSFHGATVKSQCAIVVHDVPTVAAVAAGGASLLAAGEGATLNDSSSIFLVVQRRTAMADVIHRTVSGNRQRAVVGNGMLVSRIRNLVVIQIQLNAFARGNRDAFRHIARKNDLIHRVSDSTLQGCVGLAGVIINISNIRILRVGLSCQHDSLVFRLPIRLGFDLLRGSGFFRRFGCRFVRQRGSAHGHCHGGGQCEGNDLFKMGLFSHRSLSFLLIKFNDT